eukprot:2475505-Lingulodinium_polyedra.AAC.1
MAPLRRHLAPCSQLSAATASPTIARSRRWPPRPWPSATPTDSGGELGSGKMLLAGPASAAGPGGGQAPDP